MVSDRIRLAGVRGWGFHGVHDEERRTGQEFVVDVELALDLARAGAGDSLEDTVDYGAVGGAVLARITGEPCDLIERLASLVADDVLAGHPAVDEVVVTVHKPSAPVGVPFADVAATLTRTRPSVPVVVALGGNLGDVGDRLDDVVMRLADELLTDAVSSRRYATAPVGGPEQPPFENRVVTGRTRLSAPSLLAALNRVEAEHGRTREVRWGPRTLDLDLIQYGTPGGADEWRSDTAALTLPHPRAHERAFVLLPWLDADPSARLRVGSQVLPVADLAAVLDASGVRVIEDEP